MSRDTIFRIASLSKPVTSVAALTLQPDPNDGSVMIFLAHNMVELHQFAQGIGLDVFDAILAFQKLASATVAK